MNSAAPKTGHKNTKKLKNSEAPVAALQHGKVTVYTVFSTSHSPRLLFGGQLQLVCHTHLFHFPVLGLSLCVCLLASSFLWHRS